MQRHQLALIVLLAPLLGCAPPPQRKAPPSVGVTESAAQISRQQRAGLPGTSPFDQSKWARLTVGMTPRETYDLLGVPVEFRVVNGGEGKIEYDWVYVYNGGRTQMLVRFGTPVTAQSPLVAGTSGFNAKQFEEGLSVVKGNLFDWTDRDRPPPPK